MTFFPIIGNALSANVGRISHILGLVGPNIMLESGCASGLGAVHLACESLRHGDTNLAITGGANLFIIPRAYSHLILANDHKCKTFDESADGFVPGEAVGTLVLKRLADALNDRDNIRAIIRGSHFSNDGASLSFGTPNLQAHARTIRGANENAGVNPCDVDYVEAHGTGTQVGG